jgi:AraC-like DNA-binding protein
MLLKGMSNNQHRQITDYMEQGIDEQPDLSVKKAAKNMNVSASFIYDHWTSDLTPKQFLAKKRLLMALKLLALGKRINQIAQELKFCDQVYFSKWFKNLCGIPPKQFQLKYGYDYKNGNYEKIDSNLKMENSNLPLNLAKIL